MEEVNTGGPAFPVAENHEIANEFEWTCGMTLRDYFAAKAMQGLLAEGTFMKEDKGVKVAFWVTAAAAYDVADEMIKRRAASRSEDKGGEGNGKWTPGPWLDKGHEFDNERRLIQSADGWCITEVCGGLPNEGEQEANGAILSAAPDLYEACRVALEREEDAGESAGSRAFITQLRTALAKARGEA
jgi:hypothetical protein